MGRIEGGTGGRSQTGAETKETKMPDGFTAGTSEGGLVEEVSSASLSMASRTRKEQRGAENWTSRVADRKGETMMNGSTPWPVPRASNVPQSSTRSRKGDGREEWQTGSRAEQTRADYVRSTFLSTRATIAGPSGGSTGHLQAHGQEKSVRTVRPVRPTSPGPPRKAKNPGGTWPFSACVSSSCRLAQTRLFFLLTFSTPCLIWDLCFFLAFRLCLFLCPVV